MLEYDQDKITEQIITFLNGQSDKDDIARIKTWVEQSESNKEYYHQIKNIYEMSKKRVELENIPVERALGKVSFKIDSYKKRNFSVGIWLQRIAVVLFIPLLAGLIYLSIGKTGTNGSVNYCEVESAIGLKSFITLHDGSKVWLNSGSTLRYPDKFVDHERVVFIEGEAYFEVASSVKRPFIVNTPNIQVVATGTKFNVYDRGKESIKGISLVSGKVSISRLVGDNKNNPISSLNPGQHLKFDLEKETKEIIEEDMYKYYSWKDNKIIFRNDSMSEVARRLGNIYGVDIELQGEELNDYRYRATFEKESLIEILRLLKISAPIDYKEVKRKQNEDGSFSPPKIIIYKIKE